MTGGARRCSHCGNSGHNSRNCNERKGSLKLFGVRILAEEMDKDHHHQFEDENVPLKKERNEAMQRSLSMGNLVYQQHLNNPHVLNAINKYTITNIGDNGDHDHDVQHHGDDGYLSDGLTQYSSCKPKILRWRKKGIPWTEEEHKTFLIGLKKMGRGDWRGISKNFVHTRTPMQVQKYFMRQLSAKDMKKKKKRRMSLFDLSLNSPTSPFASPIEESFSRQVENFINSYGGSSDHADLNASTFHAHHSHALPPLSPQGQVFKGLPDTGCLRIDVPKMANYALNEDLLKLSLLNSVSPRQADDTRLQLVLPSFESPKIG